MLGSHRDIFSRLVTEYSSDYGNVVHFLIPKLGPTRATSTCLGFESMRFQRARGSRAALRPGVQDGFNKAMPSGKLTARDGCQSENRRNSDKLAPCKGRESQARAGTDRLLGGTVGRSKYWLFDQKSWTWMCKYIYTSKYVYINNCIFLACFLGKKHDVFISQSNTMHRRKFIRI